MKELSLNILDIALNSVKAGAKNITIALEEDDERLSIVITDDGCGMTKEQVDNSLTPFIPPEQPARSAWVFRYLSWRRNRPAVLWDRVGACQREKGKPRYKGDCRF
jgi:hypothetical protein